MCRVMVFAGTTEGRELAEFLAEEKYRHIFVWQQNMENSYFPKGIAWRFPMNGFVQRRWKP